MQMIERVESYGAVFRFEPPVPVRDDETLPVILERLVVIATVGVDYPYNAGDQAIEDELRQVIVEGFEDNPHYPAESFTSSMGSDYQISVIN